MNPFEELDSAELSAQLKKPIGEFGRRVAEKLDESNRELYDLAFRLLDLEPRDRLLEIGFGSGRHLPLYFGVEPELIVTGVDFSEDMCAEARTHNAESIDRGRLDIHCVDSSRLPFENQTFDWVLGHNVLYFWDPLEAYLVEIRRVLKPKGVFVLGFRPRSAVEHLDFTKQNFILYEPEEVRELLTQSGFEIVQEEIRTYEKEVPDGSRSEITDVCVLARSVA